jgi:glycine/D-amino acid oxidase-like deaminating enzyme
VAFLVDEPDHLYSLLRVGIQRYGQLKSLLDHGRADAYLPDEAAKHAVARAAVVQAVCDCWRVGRGRPLTREALHSAGVSDSFIDRVSDLARDLDWDSSRLVDALEAREDERSKGFRTAALESIKEALTTEGYFDPRDHLTESEALTRALSSAGEAVQSGHLNPDEVLALFEHFWSLATHAGGCNDQR